MNILRQDTEKVTARLRTRTIFLKSGPCPLISLSYWQLAANKRKSAPHGNAPYVEGWERMNDYLARISFVCCFSEDKR